MNRMRHWFIFIDQDDSDRDIALAITAKKSVNIMPINLDFKAFKKPLYNFFNAVHISLLILLSLIMIITSCKHIH